MAPSLASRPRGTSGLGSRPAGGAELFPNKYPEHQIGVPQIVPNERLAKISGQFNYVVREDGRLIVGKTGHTSLTGGKPVIAAGEMRLHNGNIKSLDNASGHYQPSANAGRVAENAFESIGLSASGKFKPKVWVFDPTLPRGGKWTNVE